MEAVESEKIRTSKDVKALVSHVRKCFETEDIYVDSEQLTKYIGIAKYFPFETLFPWQIFVVGLHDCTYWSVSKTPRWPDLFCMLGRGAGKDGTIAWEATCLVSPYNGIRAYDVDICANNEDQALRPLKDVVEALEMPEHTKKLKKFYKWSSEKIVGIKTNSTILGRTNNPSGKDGMRSGLVVFNEIHQYQDYKNIEVFTTGLGKKPHPRRSYYTTQGDVREGPLDDILETAAEILFGDMPDNGLLPFICRLDSKEEVHDEKNWEKANPSLPYLPTLMGEIRKEYRDWLVHPERLSAFMTKRMNIPSGSVTIEVCSYEKIKLTNREIPDLDGWICTCGIDFSKITDFVSANLHFRDGNNRYDINHSWLCKRSKDISRMKVPLEEWERRGLLTIIDDVEIHPEIVVEYIKLAMTRYCIKAVAIDDFRYALMSRALRDLGFDAKVYKNLKMVKQIDIMRITTVIDSCFANDYFIWGDNPVLRWATNNTKMIPYGRKPGKNDDADLGNYVYGKIEAKSRKTDPFMALVASMTIEDMIPYSTSTELPDIGVMTY
jgi:phage terminase large subunit-like protein